MSASEQNSYWPAEIVALLIGVIVWFSLRPYIGFGGFILGAVVAYVLRPMVYALLGASVSAADSKSKNETEAQQGKSSPSTDNAQKGEPQNGT